MITPSHGYVTDVPYRAGFHPYLAPAWLNFVATLNGFDAPDAQRPFTWCDLGCGDAATALSLAAAHPKGRLYGVDLMPEHVKCAEDEVKALGLANLQVHCADFGAATRLKLPRLNYIVAHGVYSWIREDVRADLHAAISAHLKPGTLLYLSYNAMPGWNAEVPAQFLLREWARSLPGDSIHRFDSAHSRVQETLGTGSAALGASQLSKAHWRRLRRRAPPAYFAHEYLNEGWRPLYVSEVRRMTAQMGLTPIGSATLVENFDSYVVSRRARRLLATIEDGSLRELVRDFVIGQSFRRDVFAYRPKTISESDQRERLLETSFDLSGPASLVKYKVATPAGQLRFDTPLARRLVRRLRDGPQPLAELGGQRYSAQDVLACALTLCAGDVLYPVSRAAGDVMAINRRMLDRLIRSESPCDLAHPHGTAIRVPRSLHRVLAAAGKPRGDDHDWYDYFRSRAMLA